MSKNLKNVVLDEEGIEVGSVVENGTVTKGFGLKRRSEDWPLDKDGKQVNLSFTAIIDMTDVSPAEILDYAIRSKIIELQNALRGNNKNPTSFEVLQQLSKAPVRRHFNNCGNKVNDPEKEMNKVMRTLESLPEDVRAEILKKYMGGN